MPVDGDPAAAANQQLFRSQNRYRDTAVSSDGRTIYVVTDSRGLVEGPDGAPTTALADRGAVLAFTYTG